MNASPKLFSKPSLETMSVKPMKYTLSRAKRYEELKAERYQIGLPAYREAIGDLNRREKEAQRKAKNREREAEEKERLRRIEEARQQALRDAASEQKRIERLKRKAAAAKKKRIGEKISAVIGVGELILVVGVTYMVRTPAKMVKGEVVYPGPWKKASTELSIPTTRANQSKDLKEALKNWKEQMEQHSDIEIKDAKATVKQFTHILRKPQNRKTIKMKRAAALDLDGGEIQSWDTGTDRCVFDFIIWRYGELKGCKKLCSYEALEAIIQAADSTAHPLSEGVDVFQCVAICDALKMRMYALDEEDNVIHTHTPAIINKGIPPLIFRVKNGHFYAILDKTTSIRTRVENVKRVSEITHFKTAGEEKKDKADHEALTFKVLESSEEGRVDQMIRIMKEQNKEIFDAQNTHKRVSYSDGKLVGFILNGVKYAWDEDSSITNAMKIAELNETPYKGETTHSLLMNLLESLKYMEKRSVCNPHTHRSLIAENVKGRTHYGQEWTGTPGFDSESLTAMVERGEAICADIAKCYTSILENPASEWLLYGFNDKWEPYGGAVLPGLYFVETNDMTLFHGSNIYSHTMILKAIEEGIDHNVISQCLPETTMPKDYFHPLLTAIDTLCKGNKDLKKSLTNIITGYIGKHQSHKYYTKLNTDVETVWSDFAKPQFHENETFLERSGDYYVYGYKQDFDNAETNIPMYIQILDQSNIKLFDMIKASGGECLFRKTDCAVIRGGSLTYGDKNGDYRPSGVPNKIGYMKPVEERAANPSIVTINEWTDHSEITSSNQAAEVFEILKRGGCLVRGRAGTGKSFLALGVEKLWNSNFPTGKVFKIAFTNKAALNFGGTTIHKFLKMDGKGRFNLAWLKPLREKDILIEVDEISMNGVFIWRRLSELKKALPKARFLLMGDYRQCPPVEETPVDYFNSPVVKGLAHYQRVELTERQRYDVDLWDFAEEVYERETTDFSKIVNVPSVDVAALATTTNICYFNKTRKTLNERINQYVASHQPIVLRMPFEITEEEKEKEFSQQNAILYKGLPIIAHKNFSQPIDGVPVMMCVNSETFVIHSLTDELLTAVSVRPDGEHSFSIHPSQFHEYFLLNYCSTTHKQQGATIDGSIVVFDYWAMTRELKYTAVTRAKRLAQIGIFRGSL